VTLGLKVPGVGEQFYARRYTSELALPQQAEIAKAALDLLEIPGTDLAVAAA
jgi:hypothetical protein